MISILRKREWVDPKTGQEKSAFKHMPTPLYVESIAEIFTNTAQILDNIPEEERYNLFFTHAHLIDGDRKRFKSQEVVGFDLDNIDLEQANKYCEVFCKCTGLPYDRIAVAVSGNGLHIYVQTTPWDDAEFFNTWRPYYKAWCDKLQAELNAHSLPCTVDSQFLSPGRMGRVPGTENRKPGKITRVYMLQPILQEVEWKAFTALELPTEGPQVLREYPKPDTKAVLAGCGFIKHCMSEPVREPLWYAALGIVGRLENGEKLAHALSAIHPDYDEHATTLKLEHALATGPRLCKSIATLDTWNGCKSCPHFQSRTIVSPIQIREIQVTESEATGFYIWSEDGKRRVPDYDGLVKYFEHHHPYVMTEDTEQVYIWKGTHWEEILDGRLAEFCEEKFIPSPKTNMVLEFVNKLKRRNLRPSDWFNDTTDRTLNFQNGVLDLATMIFKPHSKDYGHRYVLDYDYDPMKISPNFDRFMSDITTNRHELVTVLLEFMGYALASHRCDPPKALILVGEGANGKSTFIRLLQSLAGESAYSTVPLQELVKDTGRQALVGKLFNVSEETPKKGLLDSSFFKDLTGGGRTTTKLLYKNIGSFENRAKFIFACNEAPFTYDTTHGMMRRLLIVPFDARFEGRERDPRILETMLSERSGIMNKIISAYINFNRLGDFSESLVVTQSLAEYRLENDPVLAWWHDQCELRPVLLDAKEKDYKTKIQLFESFTQYCETNGLKHILSSKRFFIELKKIVPTERCERIRLNGKNGPRLDVVFGLVVYDSESAKTRARDINIKDDDF